MKVIHYESNARWVSRIKCPNCAKETFAWRSSGMSERFPHFYCNRCSNVLHREIDKKLVYQNEAKQELLDKIAATLPPCPCGGKFEAGANPKIESPRESRRPFVQSHAALADSESC